MNYKNERLRGRGGMTLIEIILVIALIAIVSGLAIVKVTSMLEGSSEDVARLFVKSAVKAPLTNYRIHMGSYPTTAQGLQALLQSPEATSGRLSLIHI